MSYTISKIKEFIETLLTKYGYYTADTQEADKLSLTAAYKLVSGVQDLGQLETIEAMFEHASTDLEKEELFLNLVRMLPHGTKGIDYDVESEPTEEPSDEPSGESSGEPKDYFSIISLQYNNTIGWKASNSNLLKTISISTDGGTTWTEKTSSTSGTTLATLNNGDKLLVKGSNAAYGNNPSYNCFTSTGNFNVEGNIMSLLYGDNFVNQTPLYSTKYNFKCLFRDCTKLISAENLILPATTLAEYCYQYMFQGCTSLTMAPELPATTLTEGCYSDMFRGCTSLTTAPELPATILTEGCYSDMFRGCTSLTTAPELPATTLSTSCYSNMFNGCTSLTTAPELPATTLAEYCYTHMFQGCTSLTTAPELPATRLDEYCYYGMFSGCTSLNYIKCLATNISASGCTSDWVYNVAATGTFIKATSMSSWTTGNNGKPLGWTVQNVDGSSYEPVVTPSGTSSPHEISDDPSDEPVVTPSGTSSPHEISDDPSDEPVVTPSGTSSPHEISDDPSDEPSGEPSGTSSPHEISDDPSDEPVVTPSGTSSPHEISDDPSDEPVVTPSGTSSPHEISDDPSDEPSGAVTEAPVYPTPDPAKIADIDTPEEKEELIAGIDGAKGSTEAEDLAKYDLDSDGDIDDDDKELASKIEIEEA